MALFGLAWNYLLHFLSVGPARARAAVLAGLFALQLSTLRHLSRGPVQLVAVGPTTAFLTLATAEIWHLTRRLG